MRSAAQTRDKALSLPTTTQLQGRELLCFLAGSYINSGLSRTFLFLAVPGAVTVCQQVTCSAVALSQLGCSLGTLCSWPQVQILLVSFLPPQLQAGSKRDRDCLVLSPALCCWELQGEASSGTGATWVTPEKFLCTVSLGTSPGAPSVTAGKQAASHLCVPLLNSRDGAWSPVGFPEGRGQSGGGVSAVAASCPATSVLHGEPGATLVLLSCLATALLFWHMCLSQLNIFFLNIFISFSFFCQKMTSCQQNVLFPQAKQPGLFLPAPGLTQHVHTRTEMHSRSCQANQPLWLCAGSVLWCHQELQSPSHPVVSHSQGRQKRNDPTSREVWLWLCA